QVRRGFVLWCILHVAMGAIDLVGKNIGAGDLLLPIKTASYAMITGAVEAGFSRITGAFSEASSFGGVSVACLAFAYTYWRRTGSRRAQGLAAFLLFLTILSTSSTAYVALAILCVPVGLSIAASVFRGRIQGDEILIAALMVVAAVAIMGIGLFNADMLEPFVRLVESTVIDKAGSPSGQERAYWNLKSLQAFFDTSG